MLKFGHFVSWSFCVIFVFKEKKCSIQLRLLKPHGGASIMTKRGHNRRPASVIY